MSPRAHGHSVRKVCDCGWKQWPKCPHAWYFSYKPRGGGPRYRFSLDLELARHVESKTEAEQIATDFRSAINAGTFRRATEPLSSPPTGIATDPTAALTIAQLGETYFSDHVNAKTGERLSPNERLRWEFVMRTAIERPDGARIRFGLLPAKHVTRHDVEAFRKAHLEPRSVTVTNVKGHTYLARRGGIAAVRGCLGRLRAFFSWAVDKDYVDASPFRKGGQAVKGLFITEPGRDRRLEPGEWERLFAVAKPHLQALMTAALETSCRVGELLALQWQQVRFDLNEIHLRAKETKARRRRDLPMSQRLRGLLEMRQLDAAGQRFPPRAYVFGDATGARIKSVKTAWETTRLRAYGYEVKREKNGRLTPESRHHLAAINLRFHDLRREAGSKFLEGGMSANYVQKFLDHAKLSTTSRYLNITRDGMHSALERFEQTRKTEERRARGKAVAKTGAVTDSEKPDKLPKSVQ
jgi:integrase